MASGAIALFQKLTLWFFLLWLFINSIIYYNMKVKVKVLVTQSCLMLCDPMVPLSMESLGKNTGVGGHSLLQGIFLTQGSNSGFLYCRQILYHLSHQGNPSYLCTNYLCWNIKKFMCPIFLNSNYTLYTCFHPLHLVEYTMVDLCCWC